MVSGELSNCHEQMPGPKHSEDIETLRHLREADSRILNEGPGLDQSELAFTQVSLIVWYHSFVLEDNNAAF